MSTACHSSAAVSRVSLWLLQIVLAVVFLVMGLAKILGESTMVEGFARIGFGEWFRYAIGALEVLAAALVLAPRFASIGAAMLVGVSAWAVATQIVVVGGSLFPTVVLGVLSAVLLVDRFPDLFTSRLR